MSSHGLWSLCFPMGCTLALVYPDLLPSFVGSEGFKVKEVVDELVISHRFVFSLVSTGIASFKPLCCLGVFIGDSPPTSGMCISRCLFFQTFVDFLLICHGRHVWRFELCASFSSRHFPFSGSCPLGHSCQSKRLLRSSGH